MITDTSVGANVKIRSDSRWFGHGDNPSDDTVVGFITGADTEWIDVMWPGKAEPINYKSYDLDPAV